MIMMDVFLGLGRCTYANTGTDNMYGPLACSAKKR